VTRSRRDRRAAARLAAREVSAVEPRRTRSTDARLDPALNAFVTVDAEGASPRLPTRHTRLGRALARRRRPDRAQDVLMTAGLKTTCGSRMLGTSSRPTTRTSSRA
jgi:Asp-tRNA(Asn)/Glu-tRNA(Gln) amidotransferase A subunit family amidase